MRGDITLIIPAAGGSKRMEELGPKPFIPIVDGKCALELALEKAATLRWPAVVVSAPSHQLQLQSLDLGQAQVVFQPQPTGMFDAVRRAADKCPGAAIVLWCDQVGATPETLMAVADKLTRHSAVSPGRWSSRPYLELMTMEDRIVGVRESREGDPVSSNGVTDVGIHGLQNLAEFINISQENSDLLVGSVTGELSLLKAIASVYAGKDWMLIEASERDLLSFNTREELMSVRSKLSSF